MTEVGLVTFAQEALAIAHAVLPVYSNRFSKHTFTQPHLLTLLCLMRYEDRTFREAEVRLSEHQELWQALALRQVPDDSTLYRFMRRLDAMLLHQALAETVRHYPVDDADQGRMVAVDGTGLTAGAVSTFFAKRKRDHGQGLHSGAIIITSANDIPHAVSFRPSVGNVPGASKAYAPRCERTFRKPISSTRSRSFPG